MYTIVYLSLSEVAQFHWLFIVYYDVAAYDWPLLLLYLLFCDVAIVDWLIGNNNCPYIINVARCIGSSPLDVISSVPINLDTLNRVIWISGEVNDKKPQLTCAVSICYNILKILINGFIKLAVDQLGFL